MSDLIVLGLVVGLPILISLQLFAVEPVGRPFLATYFLAVFGTGLSFGALALALTVTGPSPLGIFDGYFAIIAAVPIALVVGLVTRAKRRNGRSVNS